MSRAADVLEGGEGGGVFAPAPALQRARGRLDLAFGPNGPRRLFQEGALKVRLVDNESSPQAILINTGGGILGGDRLEVAVAAAGPITVTGQACEKVYRSTGANAHVRTRLTVAPGAAAEWLPQPTILFDGGRLVRALEADVDPDGRLLALEALVLGRTAMGERLRTGAVTDAWKVRRGGELVYADTFRLGAGVTPTPASRFALAGQIALASLIYIAPDAEARRDGLRAVIEDAEQGGGLTGAASAWNGLLVARLLAADGYALTQGLMRILTGFRGRPMPRAWMI